MMAEVLRTKFLPGVRAVMPKGAKATAGDLLQVMPSFASSEASGVMRIWLLAVTA